jgi:hypothetical protein
MPKETAMRKKMNNGQNSRNQFLHLDSEPYILMLYNYIFLLLLLNTNLDDASVVQFLSKKRKLMAMFSYILFPSKI